MQVTNSLPKNLEKTINDLARAREKAAKQKYLLDLGESLVMHLCSFVLGEYKKLGITSIDLEKSFLKNSKNVSFGIYLGWLREASKFLNQQNHPSVIHQLLHGSNQSEELSRFSKMFEKLKGIIEDATTEDYHNTIQKLIEKDNLGKTNLLQFFDSFIQLRNRVAHPHKEVKGKMVVWPFSESYFDATNSYLEQALTKVINDLNQIWEFRQFVVESNEEGLLTLKDQDSGTFEEFDIKSEYQEGVKVFVNSDNTILLSDWKLLLKAGDEAIEKIRLEEEELRNKATIEDLKASIKAALDDQQISLEEMNFFESLGKTKLGLKKEGIKQIIIDVAKEMEIEDPFPEVDKRFIQLIDDAIKNNTYNEFLLKLTGQQYGIDSDSFDKIFNERVFTLGANPDEVKKNKVYMFSNEELAQFQNLMRAQVWLMNISSFNSFAKESLYKIKDDSYKQGTKEYWHRTSFLALENFVKSRLQKLILENESEWETKQNNWQIGAMASYAWCSIYPKGLESKKILALHISLYSDGAIAIGYLPDWKDYRSIKSYGLLLNVFVNHLKEFATEYSNDLSKYPDLLLWDGINNRSAYSFNESISKFSWYYDYLYHLEQIQFMHLAQDVFANPSIVINSFDISFNLFKGLFEGVNRDYLNMLENEYVINSKEAEIKQKLSQLNTILEKYGLHKNETDKKEEVTIAIDEIETNEENELHEQSDDSQISGGLRSGEFVVKFQTKEKGYPLVLSFSIKQDYMENKLNFLIHVSTAGYVEPILHFPIERVLESMQDLSFENANFHFMRSRLLVVQPIENIDTFDPANLTNYFLNEFSERCAKSYINFLNLRVRNEFIDTIQSGVDDGLNALLPDCSQFFKNQIIQERAWMKGYRYLDYVYSSKTVYHWLGWGLCHVDNQLNAGLIFHVGNSLKGAIFKEQMEVFASNSDDWKIIKTGESELSEPQWIFQNNDSIKFSASSQYSRNYSPNHVQLTNQKTYWCPAKQDSEQWFQFELSEPMEIISLKMLPAPHGKTYTKTFHFDYSLDGKNWQKIENMDGLSSGTDEREIDFDKLIIAKFVKINPIEFQLWPGFRMDVKAKKIVPSKLELQWLKPVHDIQQVLDVFAQIPGQIEKIKTFNGLGF